MKRYYFSDDGGAMNKQKRIQANQGEVLPFILNGDHFFKKGIKAFQRGQLEKARKCLERAVQIEKDQPLFVCQLAVVLSDLGEYHQSIKLLKKVIEELEPELYDCYYLLAHNYAHLGLFQEAKKYAHHYAEVDPDGDYIDDTNDLLDLLNIEIDDIDFGVFDDEDELIIKQEEACRLLENGDFDEVIELLHEVISEYPEFWSSYNNLSLAYFYKGEHEKALSLVTEVLTKNKGNLHAYCNLTTFYFYMKQEENVQNMINQLLKVHPIDADQRYKLGATFAIVGHYKEAYFWLLSLYKQGYEGEASFYYWFASSAYRLGHYSYSKKAWDMVLELNPSKKGKEPWLSH
jgi:tetratricopeptide (TPR) repeat protein